MRAFLHTLLVVMLAFALSGARAFAADCCGDDCLQALSGGCPDEAEAHDEDAAPEESQDSCPVTCQACPGTRTVIPLPTSALAVPGAAPPLRVEWRETGTQPGALYAQDIFQPPRAR